MSFQIARSLGDVHQLVSGGGVYARFMGDDLALNFMRRILKIKSAEALLGRLLQIFHQALVARVVGNDHLKITDAP